MLPIHKLARTCSKLLRKLSPLDAQAEYPSAYDDGDAPSLFNDEEDSAVAFRLYEGALHELAHHVMLSGTARCTAPIGAHFELKYPSSTVAQEAGEIEAVAVSVLTSRRLGIELDIPTLSGYAAINHFTFGYETVMEAVTRITNPLWTPDTIDDRSRQLESAIRKHYLKLEKTTWPGEAPTKTSSR